MLNEQQNRYYKIQLYSNQIKKKGESINSTAVSKFRLSILSEQG